MDTLLITLSILAIIFLYWIFSELSRIRVLLERPKKYKEMLDKSIEDIDKNINNEVNKFTAKVVSGMDSKKIKEKIKKARAQINILKWIKKNTYKNFYSDSFDPNKDL